MSDSLPAELSRDATLAILPSFAVTFHSQSLTSQALHEINRRPELPGVIISDGPDAISVISRTQLLTTLCRPFFSDLFRERPIGQLLSQIGRNPLLLRSDCPIADAADTILNRQEEMVYDPVVIGWEQRRPRLIDVQMVLRAQSLLLRTESLARQQAIDVAHQAEEKYRNIFQSVPMGLFQSTAEGRFQVVNPAMVFILGYDNAKQMLELSDLGEAIYHEPRKRMEFVQQMLQHGRVSGFEVQMRRRDGQLIWVTLSAQVVLQEQGRSTVFEGALVDITDRKQAVERLRHESLHDPLTDLPNRAMFRLRIEECLARCHQGQPVKFAVLFLDLDHFKVINDSLGHSAGDRLLIGFAQRVRQCIEQFTQKHPQVQITLARLGGDEFTILLEKLDHGEQPCELADLIQQAAAMPYVCQGNQIFGSVSIGLASGSRHYRHADELLRDADTAMYGAKSGGRARCQVFDAAMHAKALRRLQLEMDLRQVLDRRELMVYYQPVVDLESSRLIGFEALLRWKHPELGMVSPSEFVPIAEETGLVVPIGTWVLHQACRQLAQWQKQFPHHRQLTMNVNLSGRQLKEATLIQTVQQVLQETQIAPETLKLEITETMAVDDFEQTQLILSKLKTLGIQLYMDDFGTGYSSLSCLHRFKIDGLKIDRAFIKTMSNRADYAAVVYAIVTLAHNLKIKVVAEGLEQVEQLAQLQSLECDQGQGYYFGKPMPKEEAECRLADPHGQQLRCSA